MLPLTPARPCALARCSCTTWLALRRGRALTRGASADPGGGRLRMDTNVRYALQQWDRTPVRMSSASTRTPTCGARRVCMGG